MDDEPIRPRNSTIASLLFCCCPVSEEEPSLLRPSWFQKVKRSDPGADARDGDPHNWWRKGWNSVRRAGDWSESLMEDAGSCCSKPKLKCFVRRMKNDGKSICSSRPSRFQYDPLSYELNFDHGSREVQDYQNQGLPLTAVKPGESLASPE